MRPVVSDSVPRRDMYAYYGCEEPASADDQLTAHTQPHHLTPRELAWRPDEKSQNESAKRWRADNAHSRTEEIHVNAKGLYTVTKADSLSTIAERYLRTHGARRPTGKDIGDEMSKIAALNQDAYPDLRRNPHLLKAGMELRLGVNSNRESHTVVPTMPVPKSESEAGSKRTNDRGAASRDGSRHDSADGSRHDSRDGSRHGYSHQPVGGHGRYPQRESYGAERNYQPQGYRNRNHSSDGEQFAQSIIPLIAGTLGGFLGGGQRFSHGGMPFFGGGQQSYYDDWRGRGNPDYDGVWPYGGHHGRSYDGGGWPYGHHGHSYESGGWPYGHHGHSYESGGWPYGHRGRSYESGGWPYGHRGHRADGRWTYMRR